MSQWVKIKTRTIQLVLHVFAACQLPFRYPFILKLMLLLLYCVKRVWGSPADKKRILEKNKKTKHKTNNTPL